MPLTLQAQARLRKQGQILGNEEITTLDIPFELLITLRSEDFTCHGFVPAPPPDGSAMITAQQRHLKNETLRTRGCHHIEWEASQAALAA